jgi:hypothetical protein
MLMLMPGAALPENAPNTGRIPYIFPSLLVPDKPSERSRTVLKNDPWFSGKVVPVRAMVLDADVPITGTAIVLPHGTVLTVATSDTLIACQNETMVSAGLVGTGRVPVCLVDLDHDGRFDGWFKDSIMLIWGCCHGHLERGSVRAITPVAATELSPEKVRALEPWGAFSIRYAQGMLTYCMTGTDVCLQRAPRIKPSDIEQTTEFMGGLFAYRKLEDGKLAVRMIRDPQEATY